MAQHGIPADIPQMNSGRRGL